MPDTKPSRRMLDSLGYALAGIVHLFVTQRNARIELIAGGLACIMGAILRISDTQWTVLILTITLVLALEGVNSAVEAVVDLASPSIHPLAKCAKDVAAGAVLLAALASVVVGVILFVPPLLNRMGW